MSELVSDFAIQITQKQDFQFQVDFDKPQYAPLLMDEPEPLGQDVAPNASRILAAAVGNCLSASLLFCARKARVELSGITATVKVQLVRNEQKRIRIGKITVEIDPRIPAEVRESMSRCLSLFEDFCVVTQSVRNGIPIEVTVKE